MNIITLVFMKHYQRSKPYFPSHKVGNLQPGFSPSSRHCAGHWLSISLVFCVVHTSPFLVMSQHSNSLVASIFQFSPSLCPNRPTLDANLTKQLSACTPTSSSCDLKHQCGISSCYFSILNEILLTYNKQHKYKGYESMKACMCTHL